MWFCSSWMQNVSQKDFPSLPQEVHNQRQGDNPQHHQHQQHTNDGRCGVDSAPAFLALYADHREQQADNQRGQTELLKSFRIFHVRCCLYPHVKVGYDRRSTYNKRGRSSAPCISLAIKATPKMNLPPIWGERYVLCTIERNYFSGVSLIRTELELPLLSMTILVQRDVHSFLLVL